MPSSHSRSDYVISESSGIASSLLREDPIINRGRPQKRKTVRDSKSTHSRAKRQKVHYNDQYRELFNETIQDLVFEHDFEEFPSSQIGVTFWSSDDKCQLFSSLARSDRHNIRDIAADVGSKSESEIHVYLQRLQEAANDEQIHEVAPKKLLKTFEIEAAVDVSEECCARLDMAAEALSVLQHREEVRIEKKQHDEYSLLTPRIAGWVQHQLQEGEDEVATKLPAAILLNLKMMLTLSKRFFMNSSDMEMNWRSYTERRKLPSIMYTAFSDLNNLVNSITRKVVQSCLFLAMSRLRALDASSSHRSKRQVKRADVLAALDILGMERSSKSVWSGIARKCRLRVFDKVRHRQVSGKRYDYNEVEDLLSSKQCRISSSPEPGPGRTRMLKISTSDQSDTSAGVAVQHSDDSTSSNSEIVEYEEDCPPSSDDDSPASASSKRSRRRENVERSQDAHMEAIDQQASREEERRLWELLGEDPDEKATLEVVPLPGLPMVPRKNRADLVDWRRYVDSASEWEKYDKPIRNDSFAENRKLRGELHLATGLTESDSDSDESNEETSHSRGSSNQRHTSDESIVDEFSVEAQSVGREDSHDSNEIAVSGTDSVTSKTKGHSLASIDDAKNTDRELQEDGTLSGEHSSDSANQDSSLNEQDRDFTKQEDV